MSRFVGKVLERAGYPVLEMDPQPALEATTTGDVSIRILITNIPQVFVATAAEVPVLYLAAEPNRERMAGYRRLSVLRKPFLPAQLLNLVRELLESG